MASYLVVIVPILDSVQDYDQPSLFAPASRLEHVDQSPSLCDRVSDLTLRFRSGAIIDIMGYSMFGLEDV